MDFPMSEMEYVEKEKMLRELTKTPPLIHATMQNDLPWVEILLKKNGVNIDVQDGPTS